MKEKIKEIFDGAGGGGGRWQGSLLLNHPHDGVISASWLKDQYLISSPATNNNLASAQQIALAQQIILGSQTADKKTTKSVAPPPPAPTSTLKQPRPVLHRQPPQKTKINKLQRVEPNFSGGF